MEKRLFLWLESLVFGKDRGDGLCGYGPPHQCGELAAVVDMGHLETDDKAKTETGYDDQGIADNIYHGFSSYVSLWSSSTIGTTESASEHSFATIKNLLV
jgi:hypothetical protein